MSQEQLIEEAMAKSYEAIKKFLAEHTFHFWINELGEPCFEWESCSPQVVPNVEDLL